MFSYPLKDLFTRPKVGLGNALRKELIQIYKQEAVAVAAQSHPPARDSLTFLNSHFFSPLFRQYKDEGGRK